MVLICCGNCVNAKRNLPDEGMDDICSKCLPGYKHFEESSGVYCSHKRVVKKCGEVYWCPDCGSAKYKNDKAWRMPMAILLEREE